MSMGKRRGRAVSVSVAGVALAVAGVMVMTGCATAESPAPRSTVTVYASPSPSPSASASSTQPIAGANPALAAGFRRVAAGTGLRVGIAVAPVGPNATASLLFGDRDPGVAWSTIKVPLAVAAERENGTSTAESNAIINSDNQAAEQLWASLGSNTEASAKVTAVLREGGNPNTVVPSQQLRSGFTIFGQTRWTLPDAATFAGHLPCMPGTGHVLSLMGQVAGNQQWGVEIMQTPQDHRRQRWVGPRRRRRLPGAADRRPHLPRRSAERGGDERRRRVDVVGYRGAQRPRQLAEPEHRRLAARPVPLTPTADHHELTPTAARYRSFGVAGVPVTARTRCGLG
ncbi:hypothetical protein GPOL_c14420 [Gordonia polyisoprenivorans VH2]|uniref:Uncharacterized protein n=1 Tax=Gordonia polyisoprenivorans (strain DSM 44266 / VH2) TaxID=1112204 RepID=H6MRM7_GORPV|nr:hypothetical protein GPOL_c14420 [Gordonia polyisoprenivorans VH2]